MERTLEGDDRRPPGDVAGKLDRSLDRLSPAVGEEDLVQFSGRDGRDSLGQHDVRLVVADHRQMDELVQLLVRGSQHPRVPVTEVGDGDAAGKVEVAAAVHCI